LALREPRGSVVLGVAFRGKGDQQENGRQAGQMEAG
jgi:hypothetical protein